MRLVSCVLAAALVAGASVPGLAQQASEAPIVVDAQRGHRFHISGRDVRVGTREPVDAGELSQDMDRVKKVTDFRYVRFHAILDDENGVYQRGCQGKPSTTGRM